MFHAPARLAVTLPVTLQCTAPEPPLQAGQGMVKRTALDTVQSSHTCKINWTLGSIAFKHGSDPQSVCEYIIHLSE